MFSALVAGTVFGLAAGFSPGPLMLLVLSQTLRHNAREGVRVAMAPLLTDVPIVLASLFLLDRISRLEGLLGAISLSGALYVFFLACETLRTLPTEKESPYAEPHSIRKGAMINALSPHPYLFWITVGAPYVLRTAGEGSGSPWVFILSFYLFLIGSKVFIVMVTARFRGFLAGKTYRSILRVLAFVLGLFGLLLLRDAFSLLGFLR